MAMPSFPAERVSPVPPLPHTAQDLAAMSAAQWQAVLSSPPADAAAWLQAAAQLGHAEAQAVLGQLLLDGRGVAADPVRALHWFLCAAQQGDAMGMNMAGRCHEQGWGTPVDAGKAAMWYRHAAQLGLPEARYNLANLLARDSDGHSAGNGGSGVMQDHAQAFALYQQAADQGYAKASTKLGRYHEDGLTVPRDAVLAALCYQRGAEGGDFRGQFNHAGTLAAQGRWDEALHWLQQVPVTAHARYLRQAGEALIRSPHPALRALGQAWMAGRPVVV